jgi:hypothetical protein
MRRISDTEEIDRRENGKRKKTEKEPLGVILKFVMRARVSVCVVLHYFILLCVVGGKSNIFVSFKFSPTSLVTR